MSFSEVLVGLEHPVQSSGTPNLRTLTRSKQASSLHDVFSGSQYQSTSIGRKQWLQWMPGGGSLQPNCNEEGFNVHPSGKEVFGRARIGIVGNQESYCPPPDSFIGIGTGGLTDKSCGGPFKAVRTGNLVQGGCHPNGGTVEKEAFGVVFVR